MQANIPMAAHYINVCLGSLFLGGFGDIRDRHCVYNMKGRVEFRVRKELWPKRDTQKVVLEKLVKTLGCQPHRTHSTADKQLYVWDIADDKMLTLVWTRYRGTFINLRQGLK